MRCAAAATRPRQLVNFWPNMELEEYINLEQRVSGRMVLLDISGSMERYSRLMLHYVHGLMRRSLRVHVLTFGTRLTNITRCLRERDPDVALRLADEAVADWKGGTSIASSLHEFNQRWARRLLGANAAVLLVTDGLDRDEHAFARCCRTSTASCPCTTWPAWPIWARRCARRSALLIPCCIDTPWNCKAND